MERARAATAPRGPNASEHFSGCTDRPTEPTPAEFVDDALMQRAVGVIALVEELMKLPVSQQARYLLLRYSLSQRMAHLLRTMPWAQLEAATRRVEGAILAAAATVFELPAATEPGGDCPAVVDARRQLALTTRHGGFGLRTVTGVEADAALLSGAAAAQAALAEGQVQVRPFDVAATRGPLLETWHRVYDEVGVCCEWDEAARELPPEFVRDHLRGAQHQVSQFVGERDGAAHLAAVPLVPLESDNAASLRRAARLRSASGGVPSAFLTALLGPTTRLSDTSFVMYGRHRLGLGVASGTRIPLCPCGAADADQPDHAMSCRLAAPDLTLRHDIIVSTWRRGARRAGLATCMEPCYRGLAAPGAEAAAGRRRGDLLVVMPDARIIVADAVVTHPAAATYVSAAARTSRAAAERAATAKRNSFAELSAGGDGYSFVPLAMETYGTLGHEAARFLTELGDAVAANGRVSKEKFVRGMRQELSCALARSVSRALVTAPPSVQLPLRAL